MSDHVPLKRLRTEPGEEDIGQFRKAYVAPMLTCIWCKGVYRSPVRYCKNNHGVCSSCLPGDKRKCPVMGCGQDAIVTVDVLSKLVKELGLPIACKYGCGIENAEEEAIAEHEIECGHRKVSCFVRGCPDQLAMDFEDHIFSAHEAAYAKHRDNPGKWLIIKSGKARKMWMDPESGHCFRAILYHDDEKGQWECFIVVFAGENVAKKFRAEMRLSSHDGDTSHTFNCNVYCLDDWKMFDASREFHIPDEEFKVFNKGHIELVEHNKNKNGELTLPVTVEVKIKKLNV